MNEPVCKTCTRLRLNWYNRQTEAAEAAYRRHMATCEKWAAEVERRRIAVFAWEYPPEMDKELTAIALEQWAEATENEISRRG